MQPAEEAVLLARAIGLLADGSAADGGGSAGEEREG